MMDEVTLALAKWYTDQRTGGAAFVVAGTDYHPTVQSAIDALPETGGTVYVMPGVYKEAVRITKPNVHLTGTWDAVIMVPDNAVKYENDSTLRILAPGCLVENLTFDGNPEGNPHLASSYTDAEKADGIGIFADNCTVRNCRFVNSLGHAIIVWNDSSGGIGRGSRSFITIENNLIEGDKGTERACIDVARDEGGLPGAINRHVSIINNRIRNTHAYGIIIHSGDHIIIKGNHLDNLATEGIRPHGNIRDLVVEGNVLTNVAYESGRCINIDVTSGTNRYENVVVANNIIRGGGNIAGISIGSGAERVVVANNIVEEVIGLRSIYSMGSGVIITGNQCKLRRLQVTGEGNLVMGNRIDNGLIRVDGDNATVAYNHVSNNDIGLNAIGVSGLRVLGNRFTNCARGIQFEQTLQDCEVAFNRFEGEYTYAIYQMDRLEGDSRVANNYGYDSEASGVATIPDGSTSVTVSVPWGRSLSLSIQDISVTPINNLGNATRWWIGNIVSTTTTHSFTIYVDLDPGSEGAQFVWSVRKNSPVVS